MDNTKYQYEAMKWMHELELLNSPQVINTIKLNILITSKQIKEVELLIYRENKAMLVLLDLTWIGRKFLKKRIFSEVHDILSQLLPSFRFRVTDNPEIMNLAVEKVKQALSGGQNENTSNPSNVSSKPTVESGSVSTTAQTGSNDSGVSESSETNQEKQSENSQGLLAEIGSDDLNQK